MCRFQPLFLVFLLMSLVSCSYSLRRGDQPLTSLGGGEKSAGIQKVYIPVVENLSSRVGVEAVLTEAVREVFATQPGLKVVDSAFESDFVLLGRVRKYGTRYRTSTAASSAAAEAAGGLVQGQLTAADLEVFLNADFELLERMPTATASNWVTRRVWIKSVEGDLSFEAYNRYSEEAGASSAPHVNRSRALIQSKVLSRSLARRILDQVAQDF